MRIVVEQSEHDEVIYTTLTHLDQKDHEVYINPGSEKIRLQTLKLGIGYKMFFTSFSTSTSRSPVIIFMKRVPGFFRLSTLSNSLTIFSSMTIALSA